MDIERLEEAIKRQSGSEGIWLPELAQREQLRAERTPETKKARKQRRGGSKNRKRRPHGRAR